MKTKSFFFKWSLFLFILVFFNCGETKKEKKKDIIANYQDSLEVARYQIDSLKAQHSILATTKELNNLDSLISENIFTDSIRLMNAAASIRKDINMQPFILDDNATLKYKLTKDPSLQKIEIIIGGVKVDLTKDKVKGVRVYSAGDIWTTVTVKQGIGNYTLELSEVQLKGGDKKWPVTPKPSEKIKVDGSNNAVKNLTFHIKK